MAPQIAVVKSSAIFQENRMDAGFHTLLAEYRDKLAALKARMSADEARSLLAKVPAKDKQTLAPLSRGSHQRSLSRMVEAVEDEYPHFALLLLQEDGERLLKQAQERVAEAEGFARQIARIIDA